MLRFGHAQWWLHERTMIASLEEKQQNAKEAEFEPLPFK